MTHDAAILKAQEIASRVLAPSAGQNDKAGRFSSEAVGALGEAGLLGLMLPVDVGGAALGPRTFAAVMATLAEADASVAMIYLMHILGTAVISAARPDSAQAVTPILQQIGAGRHFVDSCFQRSRIAQPFLGTNITCAPQRRRSAHQRQKIVGDKRRPYAELCGVGAGPRRNGTYSIRRCILLQRRRAASQLQGPGDGLGLRANASAPVTLDECEVPSNLQLTDDGAGFPAMLTVVLPLFNLGSAAVSLGLCRAAVAGTVTHLKSAKFEHLGQSLGESLPTLRAQLATMQIETDGLAARIDDLVDHLEKPRETTLLRVLESKAAAGDVAISVTSTAMRVCGGAAFSKHLNIERLFRDAHAGAVMAPTGDVLREFIGKSLLGIPLF